MNSSNYLFFPHVFVSKSHQNLLKKLYFYNTILIPITWFHTLKLPNADVKILASIVSPGRSSYLQRTVLFEKGFLTYNSNYTEVLCCPDVEAPVVNTYLFFRPYSASSPIGSTMIGSQVAR
jgi:hypothetical protein